NGVIQASIDDYVLIHRLLSDPVARLIGTGVTPAALRFFKRLESYNLGGFTIDMVKKKDPASRVSIRNWVVELRDVGSVELQEAGRGTRASVYGLTGKQPDAACILPKPGEIYLSGA